MSTSTVSKYKWFWADQDLEQEAWLREMARQGLHLSHVVICRWTFVKGEPSDVVYRVDYSSKTRNSDYNRLFEDAGWECAATAAGWHYWRRKVVDGKAPEIFTDSESKIARFRTVLGVLIVVSVPMTISIPNMANALSPAMMALIGLVFALNLYGAIRLIVRISRLAKTPA